jgi:hypothetical protein
MADFGGEIHSMFEWPCNEPRLGALWAMIQVELLTYRRVKVGDDWMSKNMSMAALVDWLRDDSVKLGVPLVRNHMMKEHSPCGWFHWTHLCLE